MSAPGVRAGFQLLGSTRRLLHKLDKCAVFRNYTGSSALNQNAAPALPAGSSEEIVLPRKKKWDKIAVLQALASTVNRDPTAAHYMFQDDPYLFPKTSAEFKLYSLSQESGRNTAKYIINTYPKYFQKDYAEPHIPCLMPEAFEPQINDISEDALNERIQLRQVKAAVDIFDQLIQGGTTVSLETTNKLLDLLCFYGDRDPVRDDQPEHKEADEVEAVQEDFQKRQKGRLRKASDLIGVVWRENNNAERIFNLMPEKNEHSFCSLIRGMVKYGAYTKAFSMYADLLNNRMTADVHTFNALLAAAPNTREKYNEKWELIVETLNQMSEQKVQPNLLTFNAVLKSLRKCGSLARTQSLQTLNEMKALGIEPSLATFDHLLGIFYKAASSVRGPTDMIFEVLDEIEGKSFVARDPDDVYFFSNAMRVCLDLKDVELAYRLHQLLGEGENWKLLGDAFQQSVFYGRFFNLLCMMEHIDMVMKWYKDLIPSLYYPNSQGMMDLLQALDTDSRLDLIPQIWKDIKQLGHTNKADLVEEVLALMARDKQSPEVQASFADCSLAVKSVYEVGDRGRTALEWTASALGNITFLLLRAGRMQEAWGILQLFKENNRIPGEALLAEFLECAKERRDNDLAIDLVKLAASFSLTTTAKFASRVKEEFLLSEEQKKSLEELDVLSSDSSGSDSDSDSE
ncbi:pentatricopeptide repeat domain-containing protein 3 [Huso huso]|uniref:Small ribosomal subunit protein mS39 n=1 Tax=Huso huso TaxID=61971 RepID=A0ABR1AAP1_HUSHU